MSKQLFCMVNSSKGTQLFVLVVIVVVQEPQSTRLNCNHQTWYRDLGVIVVWLVAHGESGSVQELQHGQLGLVSTKEKLSLNLYKIIHRIGILPTNQPTKSRKKLTDTNISELVSFNVRDSLFEELQTAWTLLDHIGGTLLLDFNELYKANILCKSKTRQLQLYTMTPSSFICESECTKVCCLEECTNHYFTCSKRR